MLPFPITLRPGEPVAEQVLHAVRKAVVSGQLAAGEKFPSVRQLSQALRINPNTAHKIVAALVAEGVLVTTPAVGSTVAARPEDASGIRARKARAAGLDPDIERLVVESLKRGVSLEDLQDAVARHWESLSPP
ncbi:putative transcriptional regulator [Opitutaceae bacterium TAV1]|nr:GntR family transcriptional regulator [Opitutaceae bacterium TAV5]EIP99776.1 putative transcriptional regulator [Opitutaceae bacterium TAV1]